MQKINQFWIKILALVTMTIDHLGIFLSMYIRDFPKDAYLAMRYVGRIAFPLFIFMIVEGMQYTKSKVKYLARIGIMTFAIIIFEFVACEYLSFEGLEGSPFNDLFLCALTVSLLDLKGFKKIFAIIPIGYEIFAFLIYPLNLGDILPTYVMPNYGLFGLALTLGFYIVFHYSKLFDKMGENMQYSKQSFKNRGTIMVITIVCILFWLLDKYVIINNRHPFSNDFSIQTYALLAIIPFFFYNGKRGYNAKWFQYGTYLYFGLHLGIMFIIFEYII